ncbi:hypothetical protein GQ42DRAFT_164337 [Ramicandelaber brevisporus]|nr:hypothetical protein GQ42DRAFT_164337 [Ramicandelaber brevisporus]
MSSRRGKSIGGSGGVSSEYEFVPIQYTEDQLIESSFSVNNVSGGSDLEKELWLIRLPSGFNLDLLNGASIKVKPPVSSTAAKHSDKPAAVIDDSEDSGCVYNMFEYAAPPPRTENADGKEDVDGGDELAFEDHNGMREIQSLTCLLPDRAHDGEYVLAPREFSRFVTVVEHVNVEDTVDIAAMIKARGFKKPEVPEGVRDRMSMIDTASAEASATTSKTSEAAEGGKSAKGKAKDKTKEKSKSKAAPVEQPAPVPAPVAETPVAAAETPVAKKSSKSKAAKAEATTAPAPEAAPQPATQGKKRKSIKSGDADGPSVDSPSEKRNIKSRKLN